MLMFFDNDLKEDEQDKLNEDIGNNIESDNHIKSSKVNKVPNKESRNASNVLEQDLSNHASMNQKSAQSMNQSQMDNTINNKMPAFIETEQILLASILYDNLAYEQVSEFLRPEHFSILLHQKIFDCIAKLLQKTSIANPITITPLLIDQIPDIKEYLYQLATLVVVFSAVGVYGRQIYDAYLRRKLIYMGEEVIETARKNDIDLDAIKQIERVEQKLFDLAVQGESDRNNMFSNALGEAIDSAHKAFEKDSHIIGVTTGLYEVDKCMGGLHPSDLLILAGRPSMGKTALAVNISFNAAQAYLEGKTEGSKVLFFSLEMSSEQLAMRILGQESGIPSDRIRRGAITAKDFEQFAYVQSKINALPLFIDDTPALNMSALRTRARRLARQENIGLIVIDYLQLLSGQGVSHENRVQELSALTRGLKALAKELHVPIIAVSQLSRAVEQRDDKHPQLSDLRESGTIEQDADIVMFVYREAYYVARKKPSDGSPKMEEWQQEMSQVHGKATLMIAKQRHGPIKNITLHYNEALTKFDNYGE